MGRKLGGGKGLREGWHSKDLWKSENQNPHASKTEACGTRRFSAIKDPPPATRLPSSGLGLLTPSDMALHSSDR